MFHSTRTRYRGSNRSSFTSQAILLLALAMPLPSPAATAIRLTPETPPGHIILEANPDAASATFAVEEQLPSDAAARNISHAGHFDHHTGKVKWGPFLDNQPRTLSYDLVTITETSTALNGLVSWNGDPGTTVSGSTTAPATLPGLNAWLLQTYGAMIFDQPQPDWFHDADQDGIPLIGEYYFDRDPGAPDTVPLQVASDSQGRAVMLSIGRRSNAPEVELILTRSDTLRDWTPFDPGVPAQRQDRGDGTELVTFEIPNNRPSEFFRFQLQPVVPSDP